MNKLLAVGLLAVCTALLAVGPAQAQKVRKDLLEKSHWYVAPREYQIIDDRPVIRDFREAPESSGTVDLPPGPGAPGGGGGGGGAGALAGSTPTAAETHLGGPNQGFRSAPSDMRSLPKAGFGGPNSNMGSYHAPAKALPSGNSSNMLNGKMMPRPNGVGAGAAAPGSGLHAYHGNQPSGNTGPQVSSYGGGYGQGSGSSTGSAGRTDTVVHGSLLKKVK